MRLSTTTTVLLLWTLGLLATLQSQTVTAFQGLQSISTTTTTSHRQSNVIVYSQSDNNNYNNRNDEKTEARLAQTFGGYTVKQRLREEIESPFRQVRLVFFGSSAASAFLALYFSVLSAIKANMGLTPVDGPTLDDALTNCAINLGGGILFAYLTYRDYQIGEANLARIAKGGALAKLRVATVQTRKNDSSSQEGASSSTATTTTTTTTTVSLKEQTVKEYRRNSRVLIAAGGPEYISTLARSLNSDQLADTNTLPEAIANVDLVIIPVLLQDDATRVGPTLQQWRTTTAADPETDRNFDISRADSVVAFPNGDRQWMEYLQSEVETAKGQGFDVMEKGFTITVKKNGRILRRATGQPQWSGLLGTMEVMDGSRFGMPGDTERYGGP